MFFYKYTGIKHITKLLDLIETNKDIWLVYELGGDTLSKQISNIKGEFFKGERMYNIDFLKLHGWLKKDSKLFA